VVFSGFREIASSARTTALAIGDDMEGLSEINRQPSLATSFRNA
jgi:hypothetical protein